MRQLENDSGPKTDVYNDHRADFKYKRNVQPLYIEKNLKTKQKPLIAQINLKIALVERAPQAKKSQTETGKLLSEICVRSEGEFGWFEEEFDRFLAG